MSERPNERDGADVGLHRSSVIGVLIKSYVPFIRLYVPFIRLRRPSVIGVLIKSYVPFIRLFPEIARGESTLKTTRCSFHSPSGEQIAI
jgi:hypothetical protein